MTKNYKKLKSAYANDPEALRSLEMDEQKELLSNLSPKEGKDMGAFLESLKGIFKGDDGYTPQKGKDYMTDEEVSSMKDEVLKKATPEKFKDYFTPEEIQYVIDEIGKVIRNGLKEEVTPKKGTDYKDGRAGVDAVLPTKEEFVAMIKPLIPAVRDGIDGKSAEIDEDKLVKSLIAIIKKKKLLSSADINGMQGFSKDGIRYKFEELMHGGAGPNATGSITYSVDLSSQCDGVNKVFTVPTNTNFILLTGTDAPIIYKLGTDYTGSGTTTLTLTSQVLAPSLGATLVLTYIV